jgi:hypothetical protein
MDEERANELIQDIGSAIVDDPGVADHEWDALAVVALVDGAAVSSFFGYRYLGDEVEPIDFDGDDLFDLFTQLREAMAEGESAPWLACLYTIGGLDIEVDYEYDDPDRWRMTPARMDTLPAEIRPR